MNDEEFKSRLASAVGGEKAAQLRQETATAVGRFMVTASEVFAKIVDLGEEAGKTDKGVYALSIILAMAGELGLASARLLSTSEHYAGAALLRQLVEIEYLTWGFRAKRRDPADWLESTSEVRKRDFSPSELRKTSRGRFLTKDYQDHCEEGGHPVPRGQHLLRGKNVLGAQVLLTDLITHLWRTWDNVSGWCSTIEHLDSLVETMNPFIYRPLQHWGKIDKVYALMVEKAPSINSETHHQRL